MTNKKIIIRNSNIGKISKMISKFPNSNINVNKLLFSPIQLKKMNYFIDLGRKMHIDYLEYMENLREIIQTQIAKLKRYGFKITPERRIVLEYRHYKKQLKQHIRKIYDQKKKVASKAKALKLLDKRFIYMRKHIKLSTRLLKNRSPVSSISNNIKKVKPTLPWILQGRKQHRKIKNTLLCFLYQLLYNKNSNKMGLLTRQQKKLVKQFRKKRKFSKFGRYGVYSKSFNNSFKKFNSNRFKSVKIIKSKVKRQQIYFQHKLSSKVNNIDTFSQKYIYMLIMIWYILTNVFLSQKMFLFRYEIWLNYFLKNIWIQQIQSTPNNWYLNYIMLSNLKSTPQYMSLYKPLFNQLNYNLMPLKNYQRLLIDLSSKKKMTNRKLIFKRRSKVRHFFRISPKIKNNNKFIKSLYDNKITKKKKISKRLSPKEWLLVNKFTRRKYQDSFISVFSQLKNIKKIQKYIDKQSQSWHQPYLITHPYYYTNRYNTFIYEMSQ